MEHCRSLTANATASGGNKRGRRRADAFGLAQDLYNSRAAQNAAADGRVPIIAPPTTASQGNYSQAPLKGNLHIKSRDIKNIADASKLADNNPE